MSVEKRQQVGSNSGASPHPGNQPTSPYALEQKLTPESGNLVIRRLAAMLILFAGIAFPAWIAGGLTPKPQTREIHVEAYRYGFSPSRITANRGDRLRLTFSTRDTGQSFFIQDYDLYIAITPGSKTVSVQKLSRPDDPPKIMTSVEIVAGFPGWQGLLISKSQFRNHTYNGPLHGTERGDLIVSPNFLLFGSLGLLCAIPVAGLIAAGGRKRVDRKPSPLNLFEHMPWLKRLMKGPSFQFNLALPMLGVFWFIILAGIFGTKVAGRNAGPMIIWVLWLSALIILLVPIGGRIWCTVCPLPLLGEWMQRRRLSRNPAELESKSPRRIFGVPLIWPSWLSNAWLKVLLFLLLGTFSTTIVALPPATSWMLIGLVTMAIVTSIFPEQRIFCRYLCPINSYISLYSRTGRVMVRSVSSKTCASCQEQFCLTGSAKGWGCPYGLCLGEVHRNNDCGACMECVKTCAYDNVAVFWRSEGWDRDVADYGGAYQAIVMFALACLYCFVNLGSWDRIRDWIDLVDKQNWGSFSVYGLVVWGGCLGVLPLLWHLLTRIGIELSGMDLDPGTQFRASTAALIPMGLSCWIAFALATVLSMMTFLLQSLSDPLNWGWNLLGMAGSRWHIIWSPAIPWLQVACVLIGTAYSIRTLYRCWLDCPAQRRRAIIGSFPLGSFLWIAAAGMIYFFAG
jgi:polyferredoxin